MSSPSTPPPLCRFCQRFAQVPGFVAGQAGRQLDACDPERRAMLLHEQQFVVVGERHQHD